VFHEFVNLEPKAEMPYFLEKGAIQDWDISAVIGLTGEARGTVVISMRDDLAIKLTGILTGKSHQVLYDDVVDAVGELINIIAGNVKQELEDTFRLVISLPAIVTGKEHHINWPEGQARVICIPFSISDAGSFSFTLSVALEADKSS
jgi:chemotaxis protein CheX